MHDRFLHNPLSNPITSLRSIRGKPCGIERCGNLQKTNLKKVFTDRHNTPSHKTSLTVFGDDGQFRILSYTQIRINKLIHFKFVVLLVALFLSANLYSQTQPYFVKSYPDTLNKKRLVYVIGGQSVIFVSTLAVLYQAWYKDYPQSNFHWLNDNKEWMQVDKIGHATTSAYLGKFGYEFYRWAGINRKTAIWVGGSTGFIYLAVVEVLDGFSAQWGASMGDFISNAAGTALFIGQQFGWDEQRLHLKWSYHPTEYAKYRPDQLGSGGIESALKDYNGQTYWLSGNIHSFIHKSSKFPKWLNVAIGYGAEGMIGANSNPPEYDGKPLPEYPRYRQYYLTLDVDLSRIKTRSHFLKFIFNGLNFIKIPFPTLEYNKQKGLVFHPLYF